MPPAGVRRADAIRAVSLHSLPSGLELPVAEVNPRADAVATTLLDGRVVTGGHDESGFCLRSAEIYE